MLRVTEWIWMAMIAVLTLMPSEKMNVWSWTSIVGLDKFAHMAVFAILYLLHAMSERSSGKMKKTYWGFAFFCILYGIALELLQSVMYLGRHFDVLDIIANIIGLLVAVLVVRKLHK